MVYLIDFLKGIVIGIANIIPGVSGGTMAVSLDIYDRLISSISHLFKNWKDSLKTLVPILVGAAVGIVAFTYTIEFLLSSYTLPTALAFIGLILGGIPGLWKSFQNGLKKQKQTLSISHAISFVLMFALVVIILPLLQGSGESLTAIQLDPLSLIKLFIIGIIASATMVIPGVSGSLILMVLGYYYLIINSITIFISSLRIGDMESLLPNFILLFVFGLGVLIGIFLISKAIEFLFEHYSSVTYSGILGLVIASPFAILYNTNALNDLQTSHALPFTLIGLVLLIICYYGIYQLGKSEAN
ncbi:MAG: DUF368 domain-containing protein [Carnobacterium sp.]|uniref:DUF368 domain-containing protein n=1 Tax=Carnobacterium sp. TaxID=48221 RepID=UPI0033153B9A